MCTMGFIMRLWILSIFHPSPTVAFFLVVSLNSCITHTLILCQSDDTKSTVRQIWCCRWTGHWLQYDQGPTVQLCSATDWVTYFSWRLSNFSTKTTVPAILTLILSQYSSLQGVCILAFVSVLLRTWRFWYLSYISSFLEIVTIIARTHGNLVCRPLASNYSVFWSVGFGVTTCNKWVYKGNLNGLT